MEYWLSLPYSIYCLVMARYCPLPGQLCAIARHKTIRREEEFFRTAICDLEYGLLPEPVLRVKRLLSILLFTLHQTA